MTYQPQAGLPAPRIVICSICHDQFFMTTALEVFQDAVIVEEDADPNEEAMVELLQCPHCDNRHWRFKVSGK